MYVTPCSLNFPHTTKKWDLLSFFEVNGCSTVHQVTPGDVLFYHENYSNSNIECMKEVMNILMSWKQGGKNPTKIPKFSIKHEHFSRTIKKYLQ